jgi:hypothetical protein
VSALIREETIGRTLKSSVEKGGEDRRKMRPSCRTRGLMNGNLITIDIGIHIPIADKEVKRRKEKRVVVRKGIEESGTFNGIRMSIDVCKLKSASLVPKY